MSWDKTNFAEVTEQELSTHCWGTHRLRLCKQPFSTTKAQKTTCLTGLYFNLPATVRKIVCPSSCRATSTSAGPVFIRFDVSFNIREGRFYNAEFDKSRRNSRPGMPKLLSEALLQRKIATPERGLIPNSRSPYLYSGIL